MDRNYFFQKWTLMIYLDIQNAYNFKNIGQNYIIREKNQDGTYKTVNNGNYYVFKLDENYQWAIVGSSSDTLLFRICNPKALIYSLLIRDYKSRTAV
ncbi:MAG: lipocalin family protein [Bacteroidales bacterium]|nr:lipocalin family protein [Bacteroidales bacterium]